MKNTIAAIALCLSSTVIADAVVLDTPQGKLIGTTTGLRDSVSVFKGIPFAAPPVGEQRWQPPGNPPSWENAFHRSVLHGTASLAVCGDGCV